MTRLRVLVTLWGLDPRDDFGRVMCEKIMEVV